MTLEPGQSPASTPDPATPDALRRALNKLDQDEKKALATEAFNLGQSAFERGRYRRAIAHFQTARTLTNPIGARGGEIQLWLVNAYIATGEQAEGLVLCRKLVVHPDLETSRQSKRLLYILEAPELELKPEWVTQIPDLADLDDDQTRRYAQTPKRQRRPKPKPEPEPLDLSQVNTADNQFVWITLIGILLTLGGLVWFS
ncbi:tetratricopeptide repeat protein [Leptolyngbya sp. BC1307]|uniref:tetratricopeptide repeat protein n=1 Tax=Leptolyngbya sp. BC1307 TaxID=2029589 RepID=UPI000EFA4B27|nr:tetratricopeptide repeat protein [Leptolyngbya sp. BC1307]